MIIITTTIIIVLSFNITFEDKEFNMVAYPTTDKIFYLFILK